MTVNNDKDTPVEQTKKQPKPQFTIDPQAFINLVRAVNDTLTKITAIEETIRLFDKRLDFYKELIDDLKDKIKGG